MVINRGTLKGGKIVFKIFNTVGKKIWEIESPWNVIPQKDELIVLEEYETIWNVYPKEGKAYERKDLITTTFKVVQVLYKPYVKKSMGVDVYPTDVVVILHPHWRSLDW